LSDDARFVDHPMTRFCLVRHGQTDWNLQGRWQGHSDIPLNLTGRKQVRALALELAGEHFDAIYSSDLQRARETAFSVARPRGLPVQLDTRLREINLGKWEGQLAVDVPGLYPREWAERQIDPFHAQPPGGESVSDLARRSLPVFADLCARHPAGSLLVVSHGLLLAVFLCHFNGLPLQESFNLIPENARPVFVELSNP
jgi:probable phosphoglycerate mutase